MGRALAPYLLILPGGGWMLLFFLLPILTPDYAVDRILTGIRENHRRVVMPRFVLSTYFARLLPVPVFDWIMDFLGVSHSMDEFHGRAIPTVDTQTRRAS